MNEPGRPEKNAQEYDERLQHLTSGYRRLRTIALVAVAFGSVSSLVAAAMAARSQTLPPQRTLEAAEFVLRDTGGNARARLFMGPSGPTLALYDAGGKASVGLAVTADGTAALHLLSHGASKAGVLLHVVADRPELALYDAGGKPRVGLVLTADGPLLDLNDSSGELRARLAVTTNGPSLALSDPAGFSASIGTTALQMPASGQKSQTSAASIHLFNDKGTVIWSAP